jgi:hypothetical protein
VSVVGGPVLGITTCKEITPWEHWIAEQTEGKYKDQEKTERGYGR